MLKQKIQNHHLVVLNKYGLEDMDLTGMSVLKFKAGEFIYLQGYTLDYLLLFLDGKAKVFFTSQSGKTLLIAFYTTVGIIGDAELMANKSEATSSVQAITDVSCIGIPLYNHIEYLKNNLKFMNCVGLELANKLHNSTISSTFNILHSLDTRLCSYIMMTNKDGFFCEKLTELAEIMGTSYRHLLRTLEKLCNENLLQKKAKGYLIVDAFALKLRANS